MASVANELGVSTRTLRRRLNEEDATFEALLDDIRYTAATELLQLTDLPISEIGPALGFASPKIFAESFKRWTGIAPSSWRSAKRSAAASGAAD
jgi:AraC-like DNA-binding protein